MELLPAGTYDGLVVDAEEVSDDVVAFEIAITSGAHKGETVRVRGPRTRREPLEVLGLPVRLDVSQSGIRIAFEGG
jgi:hypothetical protein